MKKLLDWLFCVWLVVVTARFAATTWKSLNNPFNPGDDSAWFNGWVVLAILAVLAVWLVPASKVWRGSLALCVVVGATIFTLSHVWLGLVVAAWILLVCALSGLAILDILRIPVESASSVIALAIPAGMAPLALILFAFGLAGRFSSIWIAGVLFTGTVLLGLRNIRHGIGTLKTSLNVPKECALPAVLILFSALLNLTWAVAPEIEFDALNYHLAIPQTYLDAGSIVDVRFLHAYLSKLIEFLFGAGLALGGAASVKLFVYALGLCAAVATYALGKALLTPRVGMWAAAFFYTAPVVGWETGTTYIDNIIALLCAAGLVAFVKWFQTRGAEWFVLASILAGVAVGSKLNAAFAFLLVLPIMAVGILRQWRALLWGSWAFLVVALPTYVLTWVFTGNPVFPLLNGIFKSPYWPAESTIFNSADFGLPKLFVNLGVFPFRLTLDTIRFGEVMPRGAVGMSLLIAAFGLLFISRLGRAAGVLFAAAAVYLVILFYTMQYARYFVAILPVVAVLAAGTAFAVDFGKNGRWAQWLVEGCLLIGIVTQLPALSTQYWMIEERFPVRLAFGLEERDAFARRTTQGYEGAQRINATARPGDRILGVDVEYLRFYLRAPLVTPSISLLDDPIRKLSDMKPDAQLAAAIREAGFTRLFVRASQLRRSPPGYPYLDPEFLRSFATLEFSDEGAAVYRFRE